MFFKCVLTLGRMHALNKIFLNNLWLEEYNVIGNRKARKKEVMIDIYGGTRSGRQRAFDEYITDITAEHGITSNDCIKRLFFYFENYFVHTRKKELSGMDELSALGKKIAQKKQVIIIKNKHFTFLLAALKKDKSKRNKINTKLLDVKRKSYQLSVNRTLFETVKKDHLHSDKTYFSNINVTINTRKQATLFPPDYIHSKDANVVHLTIEANYISNKKLIDSGSKLSFNIATTHDNFSRGRFLFLTVPHLIRDAYIQTFDQNFLITLKSNFNDEELQNIKQDKKLCIEPEFTSQDMFNPNMISFS